MKRAQGGDERAYEQLILAYTPALYEAVRRLSPVDEPQIELILQETFWRAWQSLERQDADRPILPYLTSIATNLVRERWRSNGRLIDEIE
ncbi:MAG: sigma factor [Negativicutes bacterium]|nr:sigma factor [Negativicutes bacterium]